MYVMHYLWILCLAAALEKERNLIVSELSLIWHFNFTWIRNVIQIGNALFSCLQWMQP